MSPFPQPRTLLALTARRNFGLAAWRGEMAGLVSGGCEAADQQFGDGFTGGMPSGGARCRIARVPASGELEGRAAGEDCCGPTGVSGEHGIAPSDSAQPAA